MRISTQNDTEPAGLRQEILDAARQIFVEQGFEALTMRKVAERIDYSPTTIYLHFTDKAALVRAICDEGFAELVRRLEAVRAEGLHPLAYLEAGLRTYVAFGLDYPSHYFVTFVVSAGRVEYNYDGSAGQQAFGVLLAAVTACMETGVARQADPAATAQAVWAAVHGLVVLLITNKAFPFVERQRLIDSLMGTLMRGLRE